MDQSNPKNVMVVDDDPAILDAVCMILEDEGYAVSTLGDGGEDMLSQIVRRQPDLVLLDIWMSGVDGRDIARQLKTHQRTANIPIILVSANRDTASIAAEAGADHYISKPFDINDLLEAVARFT